MGPQERLAKICESAVIRNLTGGDAVLCSEYQGKKLSECNTPTMLIMLLQDGEICPATYFFNTGHANPGVGINTSLMYNCPYRKYK